ncbi:hypothetical protein TRVL_04616 [Trypanosoma vivax]|uniref:Uncharacterized protein n=1 Tax=Trypanosoma vivax (strain Y486) TaxID=1055687 RepID=G0TZ47_TRYVY|nr:hypothetical protein TRVL_04616 [Trypanosoma vivax]CCC49250.1 hypothetical protein TVY486_0705740 [Trypanosoma vivax Y486]
MAAQCAPCNWNITLCIVLPLLLPLMSLHLLKTWLGYSGLTLIVTNAVVPSLTGTALWLRSEYVAHHFLRSTGHRCGRGDVKRAAAAGFSRVAPVLPATMALVMALIAFWHVAAAFLFALHGMGQ